MKTLNVLIIEDHHLMIEGYKSMLNNSGLEFKFKIVEVFTCESAFQLLAGHNFSEFDIVFLDWSLPPYKDAKIFNGGDLVKYINIHSPNANIVVLTSHVEAFTLYQIIREIRPAALITKNDFSAREIQGLFKSIFQDKIYYSDIVIQQVKNIISHEKYLDNYNRQIIILLSKGVKTKSLPQYLPLSMSAIDKRKAQIKDYFLLAKGSDEDIVREAKNKGLI